VFFKSAIGWKDFKLLINYIVRLACLAYFDDIVDIYIYIGTARPRANGVIFKDVLGVEHRAYLTKNSMNEIILSAGALGSPHLLMLSGIGPAEQLRTHGIKLVVEQPMVGKGMADNPMNALFVPSPVQVEVSLIQAVGITRFGSYIEAASGMSFAYSWAQRLSLESGLLVNQVSTFILGFTTIIFRNCQ
jgi:hypothetical protein